MIRLIPVNLSTPAFSFRGDDLLVSFKVHVRWDVVVLSAAGVKQYFKHPTGNNTTFILFKIQFLVSLNSFYKHVGSSFFL